MTDELPQDFSDAALGFLSFADEAGQMMAQAGILEILQSGMPFDKMFASTLATAREAIRLLTSDAGLTEREARAVMARALAAAEGEIERIIGSFHDSAATPH
jgi:hypothetical protein